MLPLPRPAAARILPLPWPLGYPCVPAVCSPSSSSAACEGHRYFSVPLANGPRPLPGTVMPESPPGMATLEGWKTGMWLQGSAATSRPPMMGPRLRQRSQEAAPWWTPWRRLVAVAAGLLLHWARVRRGVPDDSRITFRCYPSSHSLLPTLVPGVRWYGNAHRRCALNNDESQRFVAP
jgi:hypothetical protein